MRKFNFDKETLCLNLARKINFPPRSKSVNVTSKGRPDLVTQLYFVRSIHGDVSQAGGILTTSTISFEVIKFVPFSTSPKGCPAREGQCPLLGGRCFVEPGHGHGGTVGNSIL